MSGTLSGITGPGRRTVTWLELRKLSAGEDLSVLAAFKALERVELQDVTEVDLAPLAGLDLKHLDISDARGLDLAPLADLASLDRLMLFNFDDCRIPRLELSSALRSLTIINDDPALTGTPVKQAVEAIRWERLNELRELLIRVGGLHQLRPIAVDLRFLRHLPVLERLDMHAGVHHSGTQPSPIDPPFDDCPSGCRFFASMPGSPRR